ncbi:Actin-related protein [Penicillium argentinense]|uniref:Actin-related protein 2/3 complex subunit 3 n=1 Tax=Penicillium argentinense TaxID=1131581 RepID=A0A9W9EVX9_9EURO|nr:Actin-related protein [Penicillium argentinense]KAJ5088973.1 Actin-related protein [Penicillium argentinense]
MPAYHSIFLEDRDVPVIGTLPLRQRLPPCNASPINSARPAMLTMSCSRKLPYPASAHSHPWSCVYSARAPPNTADIDVAPDSESYDCVDEILSLFRANVLFRNFEINGPADRMLIYGTLFISECLGKVKPTMAARDAEKALINAALDNFAIPGDVSFPLNQAFEPPRDRQDAESLRQYISQVRQEIAVRLHARLYPGGEGPSKFWLSFTKRKFMGKSL